MTVILTQRIDGKLRACSATCHNAVKDKCSCICGGKYHGGKTVPRNEQLREEQDRLDAMAMPGTTKGTGNASDYAMRDLIGLKVKTRVAFLGGGLKEGEEGVVKSVYGDARHAGAWVEWTNKPHLPSGEGQKDGFGRERGAKFDETSWLEVLDEPDETTLKYQPGADFNKGA